MSELPKSQLEEASVKLIDLTLNSKNAKKISSKLAKNILYLWQRDQLDTPKGVESLLEAAAIAEPEKTSTYLREELGMQEDLLKAIVSE